MKRPSTPTNALYVRLPSAEALKLDRAAAALGWAKKDLVTDLVARYVNPDTPEGLERLRTLRGGGGAGSPLQAVAQEHDSNEGAPAVGRHSFRAGEPGEVLTAAQAADLLQVEEAAVLDLAEQGCLPGQLIAAQWRFARAALLAWLSGDPIAPE